MSDNNRRLVAFLLGAATGGTIALLWAPSSGKKTRRRLKKASADLYSQGVEKAGDAKHMLGQKAHDVSDTARDRARQVGDVARHRVGAVKEAVSEGKDAYHKELRRG